MNIFKKYYQQDRDLRKVAKKILPDKNYRQLVRSYRFTKITQRFFGQLGFIIIVSAFYNDRDYNEAYTFKTLMESIFYGLIWVFLYYGTCLKLHLAKKYERFSARYQQSKPRLSQHKEIFPDYKKKISKF